MSTAERRITSNSWLASSSGRTVQTHAAAPATSGEEKLVPASGAQPSSRAVATVMSCSRRREIDEARPARERRHLFCSIGRGCGEHVGQAGGERQRAAGLTVVSRRSDDEHALADRRLDRLLDRAGTDRSAPRLRLITPGPWLAAASTPATMSLVMSAVPCTERGIPRLEERLGVDADRADVVGGCADERCDGGAVDTAERRRLLRVEGDDARAAGELRVCHIDARVDDRDRLAGAGRGEPGDADRRPPPLGVDEGIGEVGHGHRSGDGVRRREAERAAGAEPGQHLRRRIALEPIEPQARRDGGGARATEDRGGVTRRGRPELDELR